MRIYLASSWRNDLQPHVLRVLRDAGHDVYDFRNPAPGNTGFAWSKCDPEWKSWSPRELVENLEHPEAVMGFTYDYDAMKAADACVLLMPCGRSAHLEAGWFVGAGKPCIVLLAEGEPELMYRMCSHLCCSIKEVLAALAELQEAA